jgi:type VI secretion system secreted protein VgrG
MGNTAILAGEGVGLFARTGSLTLNASEGPVQIQAQNGEMHISAEQKLSLISASDMLFAGKKKVTLIGGGSYLKIEGGKIEYGTSTTYTRKIKRSVMTGRSDKMRVYPRCLRFYLHCLCTNAACFRVTDALTGAEDIEFAYKYKRQQAIQGRTATALTQTVNSNSEENVTLDYVFQIKAGIK